MQRLARELLTQAVLVVYDTPAVLAVPDAPELGRHADLSVLVGRAGVTGRRQLTAAMERLRQVGTEVGGTVLNAIDPKGEGYTYGYYYVEEPVPPPEVEEKAPRRGRRGKQPEPAAADTPASTSVRVSSAPTQQRSAGTTWPTVGQRSAEASDPSASEPSPVGREQVGGGDLGREFEGAPSKPWRPEPARETSPSEPRPRRRPLDDDEEEHLFRERHRPE